MFVCANSLALERNVRRFHCSGVPTRLRTLEIISVSQPENRVRRIEHHKNSKTKNRVYHPGINGLL